eukprot:3428193-Alexandrium_andersonii.AAC.1
MSASLVGSEMCIRDSSKLPRGALCAVFRADAESADQAGRRAARWRRFSGAVSYTHLTLPTIC